MEPGTVTRRARLAAAVALAFAACPAPAVAAPPYLTLLFSRTQIAPVERCVALPGTIPLDTAVAPALTRRGLRATGSIVVSFTREAARTCYDDRRADGGVVVAGGISGASWADAAHLRDAHGWRFVSHSRTYRDMRMLTPAEAWSESCGTLPAFRNRGHFGADGLFAYPNNRLSDYLQREIVSTCFAYGRRYGAGPNVRALTGAPWFVEARAVDGGACNDPALPCYAFATPRRYVSPVRLAGVVAGLGTDEWLILQGYRYVAGSRAGRWDCRARDWRAHWTASTEEYCWVDYLRVLDAVNGATRTADPKTVAAAWGRVVR